jgi:hypothetical protein
MWLIERLDFRGVELDFRSAGLSVSQSTAVLASGVALINAISLLDLSEPERAVQVLVCSQCGQVGCETGGWVTWRRVSDRLAWLPAFELMLESDSAIREFAPPPYVTIRGAPILGDHAISQLVSHVPGISALSSLPAPSPSEIAHLLQLEAPGQVLGAFPSRPQLEPSHVLAVESDNLEGDITTLNTFLAAENSPREKFALAHDLVFHLDLPGLPRWSPVRVSPNGTIQVHLANAVL